MYKLAYSIIILLSFVTFGQGQDVINPEYDKKLQSLLSHSVAEVDVGDIVNQLDSLVILDTREYEEYTTSHIPGAIHFGYDQKQWDVLKSLDKSSQIVVYCSVGYRSEKVAEQIEKKGFTNVSNLYGSIFEWANCNLPLENENGKTTNKIHTYNKKWSKWMDNPQVKKIW